jgi:4-aminobutyrate aminotransferase-like enzyme
MTATFTHEQPEVVPALQPRFSYGRGLRLITENGVEFLDAVSGTFNLPLGYDDPRVVEAVIDQLRKCAHVSSSYSAPYAQAVLDALLELAPDNLGSGWMRDITGSTANECAIKIAQKSTGKTDVLSFHLSHHGQTLFTTAISGNAFRREAFPASRSAMSVKVPAPYCYRCPLKTTYPGCGFACVETIADTLEYAGNGSVACMIVEPVLGNGGNIVPPPGYFDALSQFCRQHDILLIADEVQTGIGRTGAMFASETFGIRPNIMTLGKGLGGVGIPATAVLMEERLDVLEKHDHSFTSGGNMLAIAAARATIEIVGDPAFLANVRRNGAVLESLLRSLGEQFRCVGDVRGVGLMWGLEIVGENGAPAPELATRIIELAESRHHLILRGSRYGFGNVVKVRPALIATPDDLDEIAALLALAIRDAEDEKTAA